MQLAQTVSMAFKAISGNKVRAFLTMLGVIIGVMSVIVLIAIGQGTTASVTESISSMGTNLLTVSIQTRRVGGFGGFGGGSALDTTKAASVLLSNEGPIDKYFGINLVPNPSLPCILIPTTSGTGSEMTNISVLADTKNGGKKGVVSEYMYADTVILDAELTFGLPPRVTAMTGVDAFVHAMESFCGIAATPITDALNLQAMKLVGANIRQAYANGKNAAARDAMMYASALAGMGFGNTQNGIIHAIGTTLPVECHIPHGLAMSFCAPFSVGFNYIANPEKYAIVADILRGDDRSGCMSVMDRAADVEDAFRDLLNDLDIATGLSNYGVKREDLPACADRAFAAKRLLNNNPRAASRDQILALLEANFEA